MISATISFAAAFALTLMCQPTVAPAMEWIQVDGSGTGFVLADSGRKFVPWGFNYDHDPSGRLLEDYWDAEWAVVEADFREMRRLGANVVRVHLQFGKFMQSPDSPRQHALTQLSRLIALAEATGLYLDITGLGCYHMSDVPAWYGELNEVERWQAQAVFWAAVAGTCQASPAIFCYDLMNEPVVPGGDKIRTEWLGPAFAGKHFVQFIALDRRGRNRSDVAKSWIRTLRQAIRQHDQRHLITVGLVPWSLPRPGLTSGFVPADIAGDLDFIACHVYPESGKIDEALETVKGFAAVGKPVVIEETFPLKCNAAELKQFIHRASPDVDGWIGFYWGTTPEELQSVNTIPAALTLGWLELFQEMSAQVGVTVPESKEQND